MAGLFARLRGGGASAIETDLRRITEAEVLDVPKETLMSIVQASHSADDRREIMQHLRVCLAEPQPRYWRRIYGALVVVEQLLQRGSKALMIETSEGHHFDLVQRLSFLEHFEFREDIRIQAMVRQKATILRSEVVARIQNPGDSTQQSVSGEDQENEEAHHSSNGHSSASSAKVARAPTPVSKGQQVVNGLVSVGHRDDTTSESSGAENAKKSEAAKKREEAAKDKRKAKADGKSSFKDQQSQKRHVLDDSTDSDSSADSRRRRRQNNRTSPTQGYVAQTPAAAAPPVPSPAETVDLLGM